MKTLFVFFMLSLLISCGSKQRSQENKPREKPVVSSVNYPLHYFAQRIGGEGIQLEYPVPADVDPAYWIPADEALSVYQSADIILANGAGYAGWMNNVSLPASRIINTSLSLEEKYIPLREASSHSHGPEGEHEHTGYAFTTWLNFQMAMAQAEAIKEIFVKTLPESKEALEAKHSGLHRELVSLHESMTEVSGLSQGENIIGSHPVYQYLSEAYGLQVHSVHFEPDEMPSEDQWIEFDQLLEQLAASLMIWEDEPMPEVKEILGQKGVQVIVFNPHGNRPESGDFIEMMHENIQALRSGLAN